MTAPAGRLWKLRGLYYTAQVSGLLVLGVFGLLIYRFQDFFAFMRDPVQIVFLIVSIFTVHLICFILQEFFHQKFFFSLSRYAWVFFFVGVGYVTGGTESRLLFLLIFPLITAAVDLDARAVGRIGALELILYFGLLALPNSVPVTPVVITEHLFKGILFGVVVFYMYKIVKETLNQKYEKEETKRKFAELIELDRVKTDFITVTQHQMRTPLTEVRWGLDNLLGSEQESLSPRAKEVLTTISKSASNAMNILNELLHSSEVSMTGLKLKKAPVEIGGLIGEILGSVSDFVRQKKINLRHSVIPKLMVEGDRGALASAFQNIIDNAIRYSPGGEVSVEAVVSGSNVQIVIKDSGIGIVAEDLPYVFDRFYRGKNAISLEPSQTGISLYITKKIVELHDGSIAVAPNLPRGTKVTVLLPAK